MQPPLSLLDWITIQLSQPRSQRILRFGLATLVAAWAVADFLANGLQALGAYGLLVAALALVAWGLSVRGSNVLAADLPALGLGASGAEAMTADRETIARLVRGLRLPSALAVAVLGQATLIYAPNRPLFGAALLIAGALLFVAIVWADGLAGTPKLRLPAAAVTRNFRWELLAIAVAAGAFGFWAAGGNTFRLSGVLAWIVSVAAWMGSLWDSQRSPREWA